MDVINRLRFPPLPPAAGATGQTPAATQAPVLSPTTTPVEPAAIYHGSESSSADLLYKSGPQIYAKMLYTDDEWNEYMTVSPMVMDGIGEPSAGLRFAYDAALSTLSLPLRQKDWSFSVADGRLVIKAGYDPLSDGELTTLYAALSNAGVEYAANAVANFAIGAIEKDRYWMYRHLGSGIGVYDVSKQNFADIVDLRQYLEAYREGARYDTHAVDSTDYRHIYWGGSREIMEQVAAHAKTIEVPRRRVIV